VGASYRETFPKIAGADSGDAWMEGDAEWFARLVPEKKDEANARGTGAVARAGDRRVGRLVSRRPSDLRPGRAWSAFRKGGAGAAEFAPRFTRCSKRVEWWDPGQVPACDRGPPE